MPPRSFVCPERLLVAMLERNLLLTIGTTLEIWKYLSSTDTTPKVGGGRHCFGNVRLCCPNPNREIRAIVSKYGLKLFGMFNHFKVEWKHTGIDWS
jgi:hypothetical protein